MGRRRQEEGWGKRGERRRSKDPSFGGLCLTSRVEKAIT